MTNYRCVVTLQSGAHKVLRMTRDVVARLVTAFRKMQSEPWLNKRYTDVFTMYGIMPRDVKKMIFINEFTGDRLEIA